MPDKVDKPYRVRDWIGGGIEAFAMQKEAKACYDDTVKDRLNQSPVWPNDRPECDVELYHVLKEYNNIDGERL